jgi:hypothetical protein
LQYFIFFSPQFIQTQIPRKNYNNNPAVILNRVYNIRAQFNNLFLEISNIHIKMLDIIHQFCVFILIREQLIRYFQSLILIIVINHLEHVLGIFDLTIRIFKILVNLLNVFIYDILDFAFLKILPVASESLHQQKNHQLLEFIL